MRIGPLVALALLMLVPNGETLAQGEQHGRHDEAEHANAVGVGAVHFANSGNAASQPHFQRGIALLHSFAYRQAAQAFREAERADPTLAVAYWAEALTGGLPRQHRRGAAVDGGARLPFACVAHLRLLGAGPPPFGARHARHRRRRAAWSEPAGRPSRPALRAIVAVVHVRDGDGRLERVSAAMERGDARHEHPARDLLCDHQRLSARRRRLALRQLAPGVCGGALQRSAASRRAAWRHPASRRTGGAAPRRPWIGARDPHACRRGRRFGRCPDRPALNPPQSRAARRGAAARWPSIGCSERLPTRTRSDPQPLDHAARIGARSGGGRRCGSGAENVPCTAAELAAWGCRSS